MNGTAVGEVVEIEPLTNEVVAHGAVPPGPWRPSWAVFGTQCAGADDRNSRHLRQRAQVREEGSLCAGSVYFRVAGAPGEFTAQECGQLEGHAGRCTP